MKTQEKGGEKIKKKRGRKALSRQYPLLFPRSSASHLTLKHSFEGRKRKKGEKSQERKTTELKRENVKNGRVRGGKHAAASRIGITQPKMCSANYANEVIRLTFSQV